MHQAHGDGLVIDIVESDASAVDLVTTAARRCGLETRLCTTASAYRESPAPTAAACLVVGFGPTPDAATDQLVRDTCGGRRPTPVIAIGAAADLTRLADYSDVGRLKPLPKPLDAQRLETALRHATQVEAPRLAATRRFHQLAELVGRLSDREFAIMQAIAAGRLNKGVATDLQMSIRTVENDRAKILTKLNVESSAEAIATYVEYRTLAGLGYRVDKAASPARGPHGDLRTLDSSRLSDPDSTATS